MSTSVKPVNKSGAKSTGRVTKAKKRVAHKFFLDCSRPASDNILNIADFETFLHDRIKVDGKTGNLGKTITISRDDKKISVSASDIAFSKRYLKYLAKKFLKKNKLRDYLRVIAVNPTTYTLSYFNVGQDEDDA